MMMKLWICTVLLLLGAAPVTAQVVTDRIDRFTGAHELAYTSAQYGLDRPILTFKADNSPGTVTPIVQLMFMQRPSKTHRGFELWGVGCNQVDWIVDGKPMKMGQVSHSLNRYSTSLYESVLQVIPRSALAAIGEARTVEYRVCSYEFTLSQSDMAAAHEISAKLDAGI